MNDIKFQTARKVSHIKIGHYCVISSMEPCVITLVVRHLEDLFLYGRRNAESAPFVNGIGVINQVIFHKKAVSFFRWLLLISVSGMAEIVHQLFLFINGEISSLETLTEFIRNGNKRNMVNKYAVGIFQGVFYVKALFGDRNVVHKTRNCIRYHVQTPRSMPDIQIELGTVLRNPYQAEIKFIRERKAQARLFSDLDCGEMVNPNDNIVLRAKDYVTDFLDNSD